MKPRRYFIGDYAFDPSSGELKPSSPGDPEARGHPEGLSGSRLPPQPAQLLALLAAAGGQIVSREAIREAIWPDVRVEFDSSLHFCIRQIRSALGDSGSNPKYVETLPRRGYRLISSVEAIEESAGRADAEFAGAEGADAKGLSVASTTAMVPSRWVALAIGVFVMVSGLLLVQRMLQPEAPPPAPLAAASVGIMPFDPPAMWDTAKAATASPIGEGVLEALMQQGNGTLRIVGPSNTAPYEHADGALRELAATFELDYIVNGRFLQDEKQTSVLAELIRLSDGAHIWVKRYPDLNDGAAIADEISREVLARLLPKSSASLR